MEDDNNQKGCGTLFAYLFATTGVLLMVFSGGCTLLFWIEMKSIDPVITTFGAIPFILGFVLFGLAKREF